MEEKFRLNAVQNSPFLEGVDFFATAKKDQGSVGRHGSMLIQAKPLPCVADTTPALRATPSAERVLNVWTFYLYQLKFPQILINIIEG